MYALGKTRSNKSVALTDIERSRHVHVVGSTGTGKSKLLEHLIRQDIIVGRGLCLLDPHGTLADKIEQFCALGNLGRLRRIHVLRPGDPAAVPGFNPLREVPGEALSVRIDAMVAACAQAWNVRDLSETPRLERVVRALFYALSVRGLTLAEGPALLRAGDPDGVRRALTQHLPDQMFQFMWDELNSLSRREFAEQVESAMNRLARFLAAPSMRLVVGQREKTIDFRRAMDEGEIILIDLGATTQFSSENARLLGTLIINDLFLTALGRDEATAKRKPFTLYIDEAYDFLSGDIERVLDQTRKFGLHAVLAHQRLGQLRERGEGIYNAVMGITNKIVLGGLADEDAEAMAKEIMRGDIDLERPKLAITTPVVVGEIPFWLESVSENEARSSSSLTSYSESVSVQTGESSSFGEAFRREGFMSSPTWGAYQDVMQGSGKFSATTRLSGSSTSLGESSSWSRTRGRSQTMLSIREERPITYYSLEESLHLAQLRLRNLPDRSAIVKRRGKSTVQIRTPDIKSMLHMPKTLERFRRATSARSCYISDIAAVTTEIAARQRTLLGLTPESGQETFWHEDKPD